ncbi:MAG: hypothetical protein HQL39_20245, partial [Alphaproteobacteria bacterium]|nr:hypothetical protein [Alphaproteobacteria bacterium]
APAPVRTVAVATAAAIAAPLAGTPAAAPVHHNQNVEIVITASPGMDATAIAAEVRKQLDQIAARDRAAARSRMYDGAN